MVFTKIAVLNKLSTQLLDLLLFQEQNITMAEWRNNYEQNLYSDQQNLFQYQFDDQSTTNTFVEQSMDRMNRRRNPIFQDQRESWLRSQNDMHGRLRGIQKTYRDDVQKIYRKKHQNILNQERKIRRSENEERQNIQNLYQNKIMEMENRLMLDQQRQLDQIIGRRFQFRQQDQQSLKKIRNKFQEKKEFEIKILKICENGDVIKMKNRLSDLIKKIQKELQKKANQQIQRIKLASEQSIYQLEQQRKNKVKNTLNKMNDIIQTIKQVADENNKSREQVYERKNRLRQQEYQRKNRLRQQEAKKTILNNQKRNEQIQKQMQSEISSLKQLIRYSEKSNSRNRVGPNYKINEFRR